MALQISNNLNKRRQDPYYEEEPDWMEYARREQTEGLNRESGVFENKDKVSLNTAPSVFEKGIVFDTEDRKHGKI